MHSHSWPEISFSEPDNWQTTSCVSLLSTPHHLHSYDLFPVIAMFNYGLSQFDSRGEENKAQIYPSSRTASCLESTDPPPMAAPPPHPSFVVLRRRGKRQKSILTWFLKWVFFLPSSLEATVTKLGLGCLSRSCFHGNTGPTQHEHWGRHLAMLFIPHQSQKWC